MKNLLLGSAAIALGAAAFSAPAAAQGLSLGIEGHTKLYTSWLDQDTTNDDVDTALFSEARDERSFDILRETEVHFTGETTLDNGLSVGVHIEADIDSSANPADEFDTEEAYAFFSGAWGRVNFGKEDGAGYLLQVAAPSADSNIDGIRQYVQPVNYALMGHTDNGANGANLEDTVTLASLFGGVTQGQQGALNAAIGGDIFFHDLDNSETANAGDIRLGTAGAAFFGGGQPNLFRFDYDMAVTGTSDKLTYLTPVFNGFQLGASYTPEMDRGTRDVATGNNDDDSYRQYGDVWEIAARYEGQFDQVGIAFGGGYTHAELESSRTTVAPVAGAIDDHVILYRDVDGDGNFTSAADTIIAALDDREAWNVGLDLDWGAFGIGASYSEDDLGANLDRDTWVVGLDYTTGPFKLGASYLSTDQELGTMELESDRWTGGVVYTYGPGMTFRGSISYIDHEGLHDVGEMDATSVLLGTQINF